MTKLRQVAVAAVLALGLAGAARATDLLGTGAVKAVDPKAGTVTIAHGPIQALGWPAMTMPFKVASPALLDKVVAGSRVQFTLVGASPPQIGSLKILPGK